MSNHLLINYFIHRNSKKINSTHPLESTTEKFLLNTVLKI